MSEDEGGSRFSLPNGEGEGAILGAAAGDAAGGDYEGAYAASTQQAVVVAYHLFHHGRIDRSQLTEEMLELDGDEKDPSVFRAPSPELRTWLDSLTAPEPVYATDISLDPAVRSVPLGVWFRRRPEELVASVLDVSRLTHLDGPSALVATAVAGAVAAASFAQNGRDLLMAVGEILDLATERIESDDLRYSHLDQLDEVAGLFRSLIDLTGATPEEILDRFGPGPAAEAAAVLAVAAPVTPEPDAVIRWATATGGSPLGVIAGAVLGARGGIRQWPWAFPNDTWFVAIGKRLVAGATELLELPVPYAVEQRITYAGDYQPL